MANLIDHTYFIRTLQVAQSDQVSVQTELTLFVDKYEQEFLEKLMGYNFYKLYLAGISGDIQKYKDIRDGKEYENEYGVTDKWNGLREAALKRSPIANYVYYWWMRQKATTTSGTGELVANSNVAMYVSGATKMARAWNEMVEWNKRFWNFMYNNQDLYSEFFEDMRNWSNKNNDLYYPIYDI